jgi:hypothetical protein
MNSNHTKQLNHFCVLLFINFSFTTQASDDPVGNSSLASHTSYLQQQQPPAQDFGEVDEIDYNAPFPWIRVVVKILGKLHLGCSDKDHARPFTHAPSPTDR